MTCVRQIPWLLLTLHAAIALQAPTAFGQVFDPGMKDTGITIQTQIYRVREDGSKQALENPVPVVSPGEPLLGDPPVEEPLVAEGVLVELSPGAGQAEPERIDALAAAEIQPPQPVLFDSQRADDQASLGVPTAVIANDRALTDVGGGGQHGANENLGVDQSEPAADRVRLGERLHYALTVENTSDFSIPAGGLEIVEELGQGVMLQSLESDLSTEAFVGAITPDAQEPAPETATASPVQGQQTQAFPRVGPQFQPQVQSQVQASAEPQAINPTMTTLRWQNSRSIAPAEQLVVSYDVVVVALIAPEVPPAAEPEATEEPVNGLDSSQTQLQLP